MKKLILCLISLSVILSSCLVPSVFAVDKSDWLYVNERFENYPTHAAPESFVVSGEAGTVVIDISETDKALYMPALSGGSRVKLPFVPSGCDDYVIVMDIKSESKEKTGLSVSVCQAEETFSFITASKDGKLKTHNGKHISGISDSKPLTLAIFVNTVPKRYSVTVNGIEAASNIKCDALPDLPDTLFVQTKPIDGGAIIIDNIAAYSGRTIRKNIPAKSYNDKKFDYQKILPKSEIIVHDHYNNGNKFSLDNFDDINKILFEKNSDTDDYMIMENVGQGAFNIQYGDTVVLNQNRYITFEFDFKIPKAGSGSIGLRDTANTWSYLFQIDAKGVTTFTPAGYVVSAVNSETWTRLRCQYDFVNKTVSFWENGKLISEKVPMHNTSKFIWDIRYLRISQGGADVTRFAFDNFRIYTGKDIIDEEVFAKDALELKTVFPDNDEDALELIGNRTLFNTVSGSTYFNSQKTKFGKKPVISDGKVYIAKDVCQAVWGEDINVTDTISVDTTKYLSLEAIANARELSYAYYPDYDLAIISSYELGGYTDNDIALMSYYVLYDRPDSKKISDDFYALNPDNNHPRLIARAEDFARVKENMTKSTLVKGWVDTLIGYANDELTKEPPTWKEGTNMLSEAREGLYRVEYLAFAYQMTGDTKYTDRIWKEIETHGNWASWSPIGQDLAIAENSAMTALAYDWCYDVWTDDQKKFMEEKMQTYCIDEISKDYYDDGRSFANVKTNWNAVCNGGITMSAIAMFEKDPDYYADLISTAIRSSEHIYRVSFAPEGNYSEGPNYWDYAVRYSLKFLGSLNSALGDNYNILNSKGLSKTAKFMVDIDSSVDVNNYHDSEPGHHNGSMFTWLSDVFNDSSIMKLKLRRDELLGTKPEIYDPIFYKDLSVVADDINLPLDSYYSGKEQLVNMRSGWYTGSELYASTHAGVLKGSHMHYDSGSYVFYANGEKWAMDLGRSSISYVIGATRENIYNIRAEGHNVIVIDPDETPGMDITSVAPVEKYVSKNRGVYEITNLTSAYPEKVNSYRRGMMLDDDRHSFVVRDELDLKGESEVYWFMHTPAKVEIIDKTTAILTRNNKQMKLQIATDVPNYEFVTMPTVLMDSSPDQYKGEQDKDYSYITKIAIKFKGSGKVNIEARMVSVGDPAEIKPLKNIPMDQWTVPDGDIPVAPTVDMLYLDSVPLGGFKPSKTVYTFDATPDNFLGHVADASADGRIVEKIYDDQTGTNTIKVYYPDNPENYNTYTIKFNVIDPYDTIEMYNRYTPAQITASEIPEPNNPPPNTLDSDLTTRWAAEGDDQWLVQDLGEEKTIDAFGMAFYLGDQRLYYFKLEYSTDGVNYTTFFDGKTDMEEGYKLIRADKPIKARFVRYTGYGNSRNKFNSVTEFAALSKKEG